MSRRFLTEPEAAAELEQAAIWYEERQNGLGTEFLRAVDHTVAIISRFPEAGSVVPQVSAELPVRRVPVRRFPFHVVYLESADTTHVIAVAHDSRSPGYWRPRLVGLPC